jgi:hypothetical protein
MGFLGRLSNLPGDLHATRSAISQPIGERLSGHQFTSSVSHPTSTARGFSLS